MPREHPELRVRSVALATTGIRPVTHALVLEKWRVEVEPFGFAVTVVSPHPELFAARLIAFLSHFTRLVWTFNTASAAWQTCPLCSGLGTGTEYGSGNLVPCLVCRGARIIATPADQGARALTVEDVVALHAKVEAANTEARRPSTAEWISAFARCLELRSAGPNFHPVGSGDAIAVYLHACLIGGSTPDQAIERFAADFPAVATSPAAAPAWTVGDIENLRHVGRSPACGPLRGGALLDLADRLEAALAARGGA